MSDQFSFGIDLGTTNSVICRSDATGMLEVVADSDGNRITPSAVYFEADGTPDVGLRAKGMAVVDPERVAQFFKRGMGESTFLADGRDFMVDGRVFTPEMLSGLVLKKMTSIAEAEYGTRVPRAVITVPAYFGHNERQATRKAAEIADLEVIQLINEPTAAAVAFGLRPDSNTGNVLVFDLGGGTFDVTIVDVSGGRITARATSGDHRLGGADFDLLLVERMNEAVIRETGAALDADPATLKDAVSKAEEMKKELSAKESSTKQFAVNGKMVKVTVTRAEFEAMLASSLTTVEDHLQNVLEEAKLRASDLSTVLLVGGSSRIPAFQRKVEQITGQKPQFNNKTLDEDVARGAALIAQLNILEEEAAVTGNRPNTGGPLARVTVSDVASRGLGITLVDDNGRNPYNHVMIEKNTPIPAEVDDSIYTVADGQTGIEVALNEGESSELDLVNQLGITVGAFDRPKPRHHPIRVSMAYTKDQKIVVKAYDGQSGAFLCDLVVEGRAPISSSQVAAAKRLADGITAD